MNDSAAAHQNPVAIDLVCGAVAACIINAKNYDKTKAKKEALEQSMRNFNLEQYKEKCLLCETEWKRNKF